MDPEMPIISDIFVLLFVVSIASIVCILYATCVAILYYCFKCSLYPIPHFAKIATSGHTTVDTTGVNVVPLQRGSPWQTTPLLYDSSHC